MGTEPTQHLEDLARGIGRAIRAERLGQAKSLGDVARGSGLSKTILARIERGDGNPSVETLWRGARALGVPLGALLTADAAPLVRRIPAREAPALQADSGMRAWLVHAEGRER